MVGTETGPCSSMSSHLGRRPGNDAIPARRKPGGFDRASVFLAPRSLYHLTGEAGHKWEHSIAAMQVTRWSITFRSLSEKDRRRGKGVLTIAHINQFLGGVHVHPQDILVARCRGHRRAAMSFCSAGLRQGRALCKCRGRSDPLRRRCRRCGADQTRDGYTACGCAICVAGRIAALSLCRDQQQRSGLRHPRDRPSRHRTCHRRGKWCAYPARRTDTVADAPDPHQHRHSVGIPSRRVQQSERSARLPHQGGL